MAAAAPPIPRSYWVTDFLLAGEYPGAAGAAEAQAKLCALLGAGVTRFVDLTEAGEHGLFAYASLLRDLADQSRIGANYVRMPIRDVSVPSPLEMAAILDRIDDEIAQGHQVYVHCMGGIGRTGTVVGCYLARHGIATGDEALARLADLRRNLPGSDRLRESPETRQQRAMVTAWQAGA